MAAPKVRLTTQFPMDVHEAILREIERNGKSQNQTIVDLVTAGLQKGAK